ncbi:MAG: hypothetical protein R3279_08895 [Putridiphycobacter sp.]|nr:hypothetical protein [Putridiphycobacter sp.]
MKIEERLLTIVFLIVGFASYGQQKTALHHNGSATLYSGLYQFTDAYNNAVAGDTIYLPGGTFSNFPTLNKHLVIYGIGVHPDSAAATGETIISGNLSIQGTADSLELHGLHVNGNIRITYNQKSDNVLINRCMMTEFETTGNFSTPSSNLLIKESIILGNVNFENVTSSTISNSLIEGRVFNGSSNAFVNNIFFYENTSTIYHTINNCDNSLFSSNVFLRSNASIHSSTDFSTFTNNVFANTIPAGSNTWTGNYMNTTLTSFFVNQTGYTPNFYHDYHLTAPTTYLGLDGTEVGIFGGLYPLKLGNIPENPHVSSKTIAPQTSVNGDLNIQIQVNAQNN